MSSVDDFEGDSDIEEDIRHFTHHLGFFHQELLKRAPNLNPTTAQVLELFKLLMLGEERKDTQTFTPVNPLQEIIRQMFSQSSGEDVSMSSGHPFSFRLYDEDEEEDDQ